MTLPSFTVGHSNRSLELVALLRQAGVTLVADIRKMPDSSTVVPKSG